MSSEFETDGRFAPTSEATIEAIIDPKEKDLGGFSVRRVLPALRRRTVGPFVFVDHMGPTTLEPGRAITVRPHPHINLATVTYLFDGQIEHRDSLGTIQTIGPGAINLMTAGRGIAHSERSPKDTLHLARPMHGIQTWCALSLADEECEPAFVHHPASSFKETTIDGCRVRVLIGSAYGDKSDVKTSLPTLYVEMRIPAGGQIELPAEVEERGAYLVEGSIQMGERALAEHRLAVFRPGQRIVLSAKVDSLVMLLGGQRLAEPRHLDWNFVSSRKERIEQAKDDWRRGSFAKVIDDTEEFIPLPD